jgi:hypothetical protein
MGTGASEAPFRQAEVKPKRFRLTLHASENRGIYFSAWGDGDVIADHDASDGKPVTYRRRYVWHDGCTWEAREQLTPRRANLYAYDYSEHTLSCPTGHAFNGVATPRKGTVSVREVEGQPPLTAPSAWSRGWEPGQ